MGMKIPKELEEKVLSMADPHTQPPKVPYGSKKRNGVNKSRNGSVPKPPSNNGRNMVFDALCRVHGIPAPVSEYKFAYPERRWRFDHCWPDYDLALEVQGGIHIKGRHVQGAALEKEYEKLSEAAIRGWRVLFVTPEQIEDGSAFSLIRRAIEGE